MPNLPVKKEGQHEYLLDILRTKSIKIKTTIDMLRSGENIAFFAYISGGKLRQYLSDIAVDIGHIHIYFEVKSWWTLNENGRNNELGKKI